MQYPSIIVQWPTKCTLKCRGECFANPPKCQKLQQNEGRQLGILQRKSITGKTNNLPSIDRGTVRWILDLKLKSAFHSGRFNDV